MSLIFIFYRIIIYLALPIAFLRLWFRGRHDADYRARWSERLGFFEKVPLNGHQGSIWIHGVSLGEIVMATPLIRAIIAQAQGAPIVVTTMTLSGSRRVNQLFGDKVVHVYLPYDTPTCVKRFYNRVQPKVAIILETEIWPNFYHEANMRHIPLYIVNARISPAAMRRYQLIYSLMKYTLNQTTVIAAQSAQDVERFLALGADPQRVTRFGNLKFDLTLPENILERGATLKQEIAQKQDLSYRPVWIAASTHEGEEEAVLSIHQKIIETHPDALLILVPRHAERFNKVAELIKSSGFTVARRSLSEKVTVDAQVYLGDTMGEMLLFYAASDIALVCGSIKPIGGHNSLEAAALAVPVIVGPYTGNCEEVTELLKNASALIQCSSTSQMTDTIKKLLIHPAERKKMGQAGLQVVAENAGVLEKILKLVIK